MSKVGVRSGLTAVLVVLALVVGACSSGSGSGSSAKSAIDPATPPKQDAVATATVTGPITTGNGKIVLGPGGFDLAKVGYEQNEYFLAGRANSYTSSEPLTTDGLWNSVTTDGSADYTTRIVVRRPIDAAKFNGSVYVEWLNVSGGLDASPDWTYAHVELIRSGYAWVGVSAQKVGISGGGNPLGATLALKNADPVRYEPLNHPGDDFSYDMYSQAGAAVWFQSDTVLGGLKPERVIAIGESQSAFRLSTYINAVAPLTTIFNGYLVHSRGKLGAALSTAVPAPDPTLTRTDLRVPVLTFTTESDLVGKGLEYGKALQPDTETFREWEVPGTAHADAYNLGIGDNDPGDGSGDAALFQAMLTPSAEVYGGIISCTSPINAGPHTYVLRSAVNELDRWIRTGEVPRSQPRMEMTSPTEIARNSQGIALGGMRTPQVDIPVAVLSGIGQSGAGFCGLFGTTVPIEENQLAMSIPMNPTAASAHEALVQAWSVVLQGAVLDRVILDADAEHILAAVQNSPVLRAWTPKG
ncbi:MAG: hypothetical protein F2520_09985 [Actinobacteria bacterium]|uniref:Unannotated protein n=1 Tax=freshwater metagenome TaxID=449393 RepID=A0A6J7KKP3_9ZZZZ|nr:hypothetical protein [Actinomycetota bacterium]MTA78580.1 hypothetical protein [Actinomycetota bacterium]